MTVLDEAIVLPTHDVGIEAEEALIRGYWVLTIGTVEAPIGKSVICEKFVDHVRSRFRVVHSLELRNLGKGTAVEETKERECEAASTNGRGQIEAVVSSIRKDSAAWASGEALTEDGAQSLGEALAFARTGGWTLMKVGGVHFVR